MSDKNIKNKILEIIKHNVAENLRDAVHEQSRLVDDLGIDSLTMIKIAIQAEQMLGFDLLDQANEETSLFEIQTVEDVFNFISKVKLEKN